MATAAPLTGPPAPGAPADAVSSIGSPGSEDQLLLAEPGVETLQAVTALYKGQWNRALETAARAVRLGVRDSDALGTFALAGAVLGDEIVVDTALPQLDDLEAAPRFGVLVRAVQGLQAGHGARALEELAPLLERSPQDPLAIYFRGQAEQQVGQSGQALASFRKVSEIAPDFAPALAATAGLLPGSQIDEAVRLMERAAKIHPENTAYRKRLADLYAAAGRQAEADRLYVELLADLPGVKEQYLNAAWQLQRAGRSEDALRRVARAERHWGRSALGSLIAAMAEIDRGDAEAAKSYLKAYVESSADPAQAQFAAALCRLALEDEATAVAHLERAIDLEPGNLQAVVNLAVARHLIGDTDEAVQGIRLAAEGGERSDVVAYITANLAFSRGDLAAYQRHLTETEDLLPGAGSQPPLAAKLSAAARRQLGAQRNLMLVMFLNQWHTQVMRSADAALAILPDDPLALYFRALAAEQQERLAPAEESLAQAVEAAPRFTAAWLARGRLALKQGQPEAAISAYHAAANSAPGNLAAWVGLATAQLAAGNRREAEAALASAEPLAKSGPELFLVANAVEQLGQGQRARELLKRALATPDQGAWRQQAAERLAAPAPSREAESQTQ
jgi:tetratricopeptide (TPR) repeat protein